MKRLLLGVLFFSTVTAMEQKKAVEQGGGESALCCSLCKKQFVPPLRPIPCSEAFENGSDDHYFHDDCLEKMLKAEECSCPVCGKDFTLVSVTKYLGGPDLIIEFDSEVERRERELSLVLAFILGGKR